MTSEPVVLTCTSVQWTWPTIDNTVIDFDRVSGVRYEPKEIRGGNYSDGPQYRLGFEDAYKFTALHFGPDDIQMIASYNGQPGILRIKLEDNQQVVVSGRIFFTPGWNFGTNTMGIEVTVERITPVGDMTIHAPIDSSELFRYSYLNYDVSIQTKFSPVSITSITASVSPYTSATVVTSAAHNLTAGKWIYISGNTQTLYNNWFCVQSVTNSTTFVINVPLASPSSGTGGTMTRWNEVLYSRADIQIVVLDDYSVEFYLKNFLGKDQEGDHLWNGWSAFKALASVYSITVPTDQADATVMDNGFGIDGWVLDADFNPLDDEAFQLVATLPEGIVTNPTAPEYYTNWLKRHAAGSYELYEDGYHQILRTQGIKLEPGEFMITEGVSYAGADHGHFHQKYAFVNGLNAYSAMPYSTTIGGLAVQMVTSVTTAGSNTVFNFRKNLDPNYQRRRCKITLSGGSVHYGEYVAWTADDMDLSGASAGFDYRYTIKDNKLIFPAGTMIAIYFFTKAL